MPSGLGYLDGLCKLPELSREVTMPDKPHQLHPPMSPGLKWSLVGGGTGLLIAIIIAILNTYTDLFEDVLKPKPKVVALNYVEPDEVNDDTPAKKLSDEVRNAYNQVDRVSAQVMLGSTCTVQLHVSRAVLGQWTKSKSVVEGVLEDVRSRGKKHAKSPKCVVDVIADGETKVRALPKGSNTRFEYY